jgi:hypothetical protein
MLVSRAQWKLSVALATDEHNHDFNKTLLYNFIPPRSHVESWHLLTAGLVACLIGFVFSWV